MLDPKRQFAIRLLGFSATTLCLTLGLTHSVPSGGEIALRQTAAESVALQRTFIWKLWESVSRPTGANQAPAFETWHGEEEVFASTGTEPSSTGPRFTHTSTVVDVGAPVITYTLYNGAAYRHIREHQLYRARELQRLRREGAADPRIPGNRTVPEFPEESSIVKTVWWPVSASSPSPLPVWSEAQVGVRQAGSGYLTWGHIITVAVGKSREDRSEPVEFAGRVFSKARRFELDSFHHILVTRSLADHLREDGNARKAAAIVLGRPLEAGDYLILVGVSLASRATHDWVWAALWWSDSPDEGAFALGKPSALNGWRRAFLMNTAFDSNEPRDAWGGPHVCFNPWLDARLPDGGFGAGTVSNCMTCHRRAAYPPVGFLPVTRGDPDFRHDPAFAPGLLRTSFLWGLAQQATDSSEEASHAQRQ